MRHTAVLVLGCMLLTLALAACGGGPSEAEIEATVVARIDEKQAEDAALEAKAQDMVKAMVEATAQAAPTATPLPPAPTPTPTPLSSISILSYAKKAMEELQSYKLDMEAVIKVKTTANRCEPHWS